MRRRLLLLASLLASLLAALLAPGCIAPTPTDEGVGAAPLERELPVNVTGTLARHACAPTPEPTCVGPARSLVVGPPDAPAGDLTVTLAWVARTAATQELTLGVYRLLRACDESNCTPDDMEEVNVTRGASPLVAEGFVNGTYALVVAPPRGAADAQPADQDFTLTGTLVVVPASLPDVPPVPPLDDGFPWSRLLAGAAVLAVAALVVLALRHLR